MKVKQKSIEQLIEDLKEPNMLGQLLLDNVDEVLFFYSMEGKLIYVSNAFQKITGYSTQELYEKNFIPYAHPDDQEWIMKLWQGLFKGEIFDDVEYRIVKKDGEIRWNSSSWKIVFDNDGRQIGIQGKQQDITERKVIEQQLKESEQYNRMLFEESTIGLALCRMNGDLIDINPAFASILGRTIEETMKLSYWDITPEKYAREEQRQLELLEQTGRYGPYEKEYIHADGHLVPVRLSGQILEKDGENFIWSSTEDITERKQAEEAMQRSEVLVRLTSGAPLTEILTALVINAEKHNPEMLCSVLLLDPGGNRLRYGAAPSLTDFYSEAIVGEEIGPEVASCGAAAHSGKRVIVEDIMTHRNWESDRELAQNAGLGACWSEPVISSTGVILGTFAIYYREPRAPQQQDLDFIQDSARLAGIAIEQKQAEEALRKERDKAQRYLDTVEAMMVALDISGHITMINRKACALLGYKEQELIGKNWFTTCLPQSALEDGVFEVFEQVMVGDFGNTEYYENLILTRSGEERIIAWHNNILHDDDDNIIGTLSAGEDITERKRSENALRNIVEGTAPVIGQDFFRILVKHLASALDVRYAFVGELVGDKGDHIHTLAVWSGADYSENYEYSLSGTPCEKAVDQVLCCFPQNIQQLYPKDHTLAEMGAESYIGTPLFDCKGQTLGILAILHDESIEDTGLAESIVSIFAGRAAVELQRKQAEEKTLELLQQNRHLTQRLFQIQEQERQHLARELHDEFGQWITVITLHTQIMKGMCSHYEKDARDSIKIIEGVSRKMHQGLRQMIHQLRPVVLDELGLKDSLQELVDQWQAHYPQTDCVLGMEGSLNDFDEMVNVTVYRIVQESLTNVAKYAEADNVLIQLRRHTVQTEDIDGLILNIEDDGIGINLDKPEQGFGVAGMRERVLAVGGEFVLKSSPGAGVHIEVQLPISTLIKG